MYERGFRMNFAKASLEDRQYILSRKLQREMGTGILSLHFTPASPFHHHTP